MVRPEPQLSGSIAHTLKPLRPQNEIIPERMETDGVCPFARPDIEASAAAGPFRWGKLRGEESHRVEELMHITDEMEDPTERYCLGALWSRTLEDIEVRLIGAQDVVWRRVHRLYRSWLSLGFVGGRVPRDNG